MLIMAVLLIAGTAFLTISATEVQIAVNERAAAQASLLAEAAIHQAIAKLNAGQNPAGTTSLPAGNGFKLPAGSTYTVTVTPATGCTATSAQDLEARALVPVRGGQAQVVLRVTVDQVSYPYGWAAFTTVPDTILTGDDVFLATYRTTKELWLGDSNQVDSFDSSLGPYNAVINGVTNSGKGGNIGGNADVSINWNSGIQGRVKAGDDIYYNGSLVYEGSLVTVDRSRISKTAEQGAEAEIFPTVTPTQPLTVVPPATPEGDLILNSGTMSLSGTHVFRDMIFSNNTSLTTSGGPVTIFVTRNALFGNNVTLGANPATQLQIILKSDGTDWGPSWQEPIRPRFSTGDSFRLYGSLYGRNTDIYLGADSQIYGSIIGRTIFTKSGVKLHYDQALSDKALCHNGKFAIRRGTWREVIP
jgi:hypothetical protein